MRPRASARERSGARLRPGADPGAKNIDNCDPTALTFCCDRSYSRRGTKNVCSARGICGAPAAITQNEEAAMLSSAYPTCGGMR